MFLHKFTALAEHCLLCSCLSWNFFPLESSISRVWLITDTINYNLLICALRILESTYLSQKHDGRGRGRHCKTCPVSLLGQQNDSGLSKMCPAACSAVCFVQTCNRSCTASKEILGMCTACWHFFLVPFDWRPRTVGTKLSKKRGFNLGRPRPEVLQQRDDITDCHVWVTRGVTESNWTQRRLLCGYRAPVFGSRLAQRSAVQCCAEYAEWKWRAPLAARRWWVGVSAHGSVLYVNTPHAEGNYILLFQSFLHFSNNPGSSKKPWLNPPVLQIWLFWFYVLREFFTRERNCQKIHRPIIKVFLLLWFGLSLGSSVTFSKK